MHCMHVRDGASKRRGTREKGGTDGGIFPQVVEKIAFNTLSYCLACRFPSHPAQPVAKRPVTRFSSNGESQNGRQTIR
jgi:hypothetical protein